MIPASRNENFEFYLFSFGLNFPWTVYGIANCLSPLASAVIF